MSLNQCHLFCYGSPSLPDTSVWDLYCCKMNYPNTELPKTFIVYHSPVGFSGFSWVVLLLHIEVAGLTLASAFHRELPGARMSKMTSLLYLILQLEWEMAVASWASPLPWRSPWGVTQCPFLQILLVRVYGRSLGHPRFRSWGNWPHGFMERTICAHRDILDIAAIIFADKAGTTNAATFD